ncbi:MAG: leucine-rich repeat protein, partial [Clostridia bacterium]|nr:leucine-rich repeat protein [Clostridia bacterium]
TIPEKSFSNCTGITNITIPDSVISIGERAFLNCTGLTNIVIPESVTIISNYLFSGCTNLAIITLPDTITQIGEGAFNNTAYYNNTANWSDNMLYIGKCLIKGKTDLAGNKSVKSGTTCIADSALYGCNKIITLTVPTSVKHIGSSAFYNVTNIAYTSTATGSPWGARCLNGYTDGNFVYSDSSKAKLVACSGLATGSIVIPPSTDTIGNNAFSACSTITNIYLPVNVTRIGNSAFQNASLSDVYYEGSTVDKLGISFGDNNAKITDATWHYNSKVTDMPGSPSNPDNPSNPENPDSPPSTNIPEANIINGNAANNQKTYDYKTTVTFTANVPAGGSVQWYVNGNKAGTDSTLTVKESTSSYTVKVVVTDKNGNQTMDEEAVTIKNGFFDKLIWFFVHLFNPGAYDVKQ